MDIFINIIIRYKQEPIGAFLKKTYYNIIFNKGIKGPKVGGVRIAFLNKIYYNIIIKNLNL